MRILIVDDDELLRTVCTGMLNVMRHEAVAVESGADALRSLVTNGEIFDLMLIDEAMPEMNGRETLAQLSAAGVSIPVIVCSGKTTSSGRTQMSPEYGRIATLAKPFTMDQLALALEVATTSQQPG